MSRQTIRRLSEGESVDSFNCGDDYQDLNEFIVHDAPFYRSELLAVSYIVEDDNRTSAYFSLANDRIGIEDFESNAAFNRFRRKRFINAKRIRHYPAVKICRLGVCVDRQGTGLGPRLINMIKLYFLEDNKSGCRYITVDAHRGAVRFYIKNVYQMLTENDVNDQTRLMYFDLMALKV